MAKKDDKAEAEQKREASQEDAPEKDREEGEVAEGGEGLEPPRSKLTKKKKIIIAAAAAVALLLGGGAGLYFSGTLGGHKTEVEGEQSAEQKEGHGAEAEKAGDNKNAEPAVFFSLGDILVNLAGDGKRPNFLKIKVSLELSSEKDKTAIESMLPRIVDNFQVYLRELRIEDLRGSAGLQRLREELLLRVTEVAAPVHVRDVLFQEILVQ